MGGGTTNSKPPGRIIMMGQSETRSSSSQIIFIILFCAGLVYLLPATAKLCNCAERKPISWAKLGCFDLFFIQFYCAGSHTEYRWRCSYTNTPKQKLRLPELCPKPNFKENKPLVVEWLCRLWQAKPNFKENKLLLVEWFCPLGASSNETI
jgi:hypothetical protein